MTSLEWHCNLAVSNGPKASAHRWPANTHTPIKRFHFSSRQIANFWSISLTLSFPCSNQSSSIMQILWCMYLPPTNSSSGGGGRSRSRRRSSTVGHWFSVPHLDCAQPARRIQGRGKLTSWMPIPKPNHWQSGWPGKKVHGVSTRVCKVRIRGIRSSCLFAMLLSSYRIVNLKLGVSVSLELLFATGFVHWTMAVVRGRRDSYVVIHVCFLNVLAFYGCFCLDWRSVTNILSANCRTFYLWELMVVGLILCIL